MTGRLRMSEKNNQALTYNILYIEDNPGNIRLMQELFELHQEFRFHKAMSGDVGYQLALDLLPDLILMDINLPGMNGYQVLHQLQSNYDTKDIPVIAISANSMVTDIDHGIDAGFTYYVTKPFDATSLFELIQDAIKLSVD